jgi:hypothetical protein
MTVARVLLGTTRYEVTVKRDANGGQHVHSLVMRQMGVEDAPAATAYPLPKLDFVPGQPQQLQCVEVIDLPVYIEMVEPLTSSKELMCE